MDGSKLIQNTTSYVYLTYDLDKDPSKKEINSTDLTILNYFHGRRYSPNGGDVVISFM